MKHEDFVAGFCFEVLEIEVFVIYFVKQASFAKDSGEFCLGFFVDCDF